MLDLAAVARLAAGVVGEGAVLSVELEGAGWDHVAYRVETTEGPWIVRGATTGEGTGLAAGALREVAVMQLVRRRLGGWAADAVVLDAELGCIAHRRVPGVPLQDLLAAGTVGSDVVASVAGRVGALMGEIGHLDPVEADGLVEVDDDGLDVWRADVPSFVEAIGDVLTPARRSAVDELLAAPLPAPPTAAELVLVHNDLGAEHVLVDPPTGSITGIIDWSDAVVADPAADVGRLLRDLGEVHLPAVLDGLGTAGPRRDALTTRAWWYARLLVLEDLAYAVEHRPDLVPFELASLDRLY